MDKHLVIFQPSGRRGYVEEGVTLLEAARQIGEGLESICGGKATCGKCRVHIEEGEFAKYGIESGPHHLSPAGINERAVLTGQDGAGDRLACSAGVLGDVVVFVPEGTRLGNQVVRKDPTSRSIDLNPAVRNYFVELVPPNLGGSDGDWERLAAELGDRFGLRSLEIDYRTLQSLQRVVREGQWRVTATVWLGREVIRVRPGKVTKSYGLAVDIGTTTVAGYLCDLEDGRVVATGSLMNPQLAYGEDVMSRITYAGGNSDGLGRLHAAIVEAVNSLASDLTGRVGASAADVVDAVLVGNTVMHHLLLGFDPSYLGRAPFPLACHHSVDIKAREVGLELSPGSYVHVLPVEASFVGADNVAVLLAEEPYNQPEQWLIIDIGTNGEIVLGNRDRLLCASCATGPALEGGHIRFGMRAAPGAIERVRIDPKTWETRYRVIGQDAWSTGLRPEEIRAQGICGTGVIEAVAEMLAADVLEPSGRLNVESGHPRLRSSGDGPEFVIAWASESSSGRDITLSQRDVEAVALAKAALYGGAQVLLRRLGLDRPDKVIVAGAFGSMIDPRRAMAIGLFPECEPDDILTVGNAAGDGARIALLNVEKRAEADWIARRVEHVELALDSNFEDEYLSALYFPHMEDSLV